MVIYQKGNITITYDPTRASTDFADVMTWPPTLADLQACKMALTGNWGFVIDDWHARGLV